MIESGIGLLYIDPGTGSLIVSILVGLVTVLGFSIRNVLHKIIGFVRGSTNEVDCDFEGKLVFFNEGAKYWNVFSPVLEALIETKQECVYLTADKQDPCLEMTSEYVESKYIGNISAAIFSLNRMKAAVCVMTTPQLHIMQLKRSKFVGHYCYLMHSAMDMHAYERYALDSFDSVLCSSTYQIKTIRSLEEKRNETKKILFETGCTYFDKKVKEETEQSTFEENKSKETQTVLIAPTWGEQSFLEAIEKILESVLELGVEVILRPHPQSWISDKEQMEYIEETYGQHITIDKSIDNTATLKKADVLICDISGMIYDFVFMFQKPIIVIEKQYKIPGYEYTDLEHEDSARILAEETGFLLPIEEAEKIGTLVSTLKATKIESAQIDKHIYNYGRAGKIAAEQIVSILKEQL